MPGWALSSGIEATSSRMETDVALLENMEKYAEAMRSSGRRAIEQAKRAGVPAYYVDPALGDGIIKELPDGTRQRIQPQGDEDVVIETLSRAP